MYNECARDLYTIYAWRLFLFGACVLAYAAFRKHTSASVRPLEMHGRYGLHHLSSIFASSYFMACVCNSPVRDNKCMRPPTLALTPAVRIALHASLDTPCTA